MTKPELSDDDRAIIEEEQRIAERTREAVQEAPFRDRSNAHLRTRMESLREQMRGEIRRIQKVLGITSVYVTHDQVEAMTISDRVVVMNEGRIEQVGSPTEIYRHPQSQFVADFIGRANFITGIVQAQRDGRLDVNFLGHSMNVPAAEAHYTIGTEVTVVVRPEMMVLNPPEAHVNGLVRQASYLGNVTEYEVEVQGQILALVENDPRHITIHRPGEEVQVGFLEDCLYVLPAQS